MPNQVSVCTGGPEQEDPQKDREEPTGPTIERSGRKIITAGRHVAPRPTREPPEKPQRAAREHQRAPTGAPREPPETPTEPEQEAHANRRPACASHPRPGPRKHHHGDTKAAPGIGQEDPQGTPRPRWEPYADKGKHASPSQDKANKTGVQN